MGVISRVDESKAIRLNEITKGMSVKRRSKECTPGSSEARGQEEGGTSQCRGGEPLLFPLPRESQVGTMSLQEVLAPCCWWVKDEA